MKTNGETCQVCGRLSGFPGMGICFYHAQHGPEWAQHEAMAWLEDDLAKKLKDDIARRKFVEKQLTKKKPNKLRVIYY